MITEEKARQVYSELVECSRHPEVSKGRGIVRYYRGLFRSLSEPEDGAPGGREWNQFGRSVWLSLIMVKAFYTYSTDRSKYLVNPQYKNFVYYQADKHTLGNLCELISHHGGKLHKDSFFIEVLEQVRRDGAVALIEKLLDEEGLRNCFNQRLYLKDAGRKSGFLEFSPAYLSRGEVLAAAKRFADKYSQGIAAAYQLEFDRLKKFLLKNLNGLLDHMIAAVEEGDSFARIRLLLQQSKRFGGLVKKIEDNDFSKLLSVVIKPFGDVSYCDDVHEALAVELAIENMAPESFFKKTGIPLASIDGGWASVRRGLLKFAKQ